MDRHPHHLRTESLLRHVLRAALPLVRADLGGFFVFDEAFATVVLGTIVGEQPAGSVPPIEVARVPPATVPAERWLREQQRPLHLFRPSDWRRFPPVNPGLRELAERGRLVGLAVPLRWEDEVIGVAYFWRHRTPVPFARREIREAERWCQLAAAAAFASRLLQRETALRTDLEQLLELERNLRSTGSPGVVALALREALQRFLGAVSIVVALAIDHDLHVVTTEDAPPASWDRTQWLTAVSRLAEQAAQEWTVLTRKQARRLFGAWVDRLPATVDRLLAIAIANAGEALGLVLVWSATSPPELVREKVPILPLFVRHVAAAVSELSHRLRLEETIEHLRALLAVAQYVAVADTPSDLLDQVERTLRHRLRYDAMIYLEPDGGTPGTLRVAWGSGTHPEAEIGNRIPIDRSLAGYVFRTGRPLSIADTWEDPRTYHRPDRKFPLRSLVLHPIVIQERVTGVLGFGRASVDPFSEFDRQLTGLVARELSTALVVVEQRRALREQAESEALLSDLSELLLRESDPHVFARPCVERLAAWARTEVALALRCPLNHGQLVVASSGFDRELLRQVETLVESDFARWLSARSRATVQEVHDVGLVPPPLRPPFVALLERYERLTVLPLEPSGLPSGFLLLAPSLRSLHTQRGEETLRDVRLRVLEALDRWILGLEREYANRLTYELATSSDESSFAQAFLERTIAAIPSDLGAILRPDEDQRQLLPLAATTCFRALPPDWGIPLDDLVPVLQHPFREATIVPSDRAAPLGYLVRHLAAGQPVSLLAAPVVGLGGSTGLVLLGRFGREGFIASERRRLTALATSAALALEVVHTRERERSLYRASVEALAAAVDARDPATHDHSRRVARIARTIAERMGLPRDEIERIELAALLHDIGKLGVPDDVLRKPSKLTPSEWAIVRAHPSIGAEILAAHPQLQAIVPLVAAHHERWDGRGYPRGLRGDEIPLGAAIIGLADAFDTMISDRPYRPALRPSEAVEEIRRCRGTQFHPAVVDAFLQALQDPKGLPLLLSGWIGTPASPLTVSALHEVGERLATGADLPSLAEAIDLAISGTITNDNIVIFLLDETEEVLRIVYSRHDWDIAAQVRLPRGQGLAWRAVLTRAPHAVVVSEAPTGTVVIWGRRPIAAVLVAPLLDGDRAVGVLAVSRTEPRPFTARDAEVLASLGRHLGPLLAALSDRNTDSSAQEVPDIDCSDRGEQNDQDRLVNQVERETVPSQPAQEPHEPEPSEVG